MKKILPGILAILLATANSMQAQAVWDGNAETGWYNPAETDFTITTAGQLAGLAQLVNAGNITACRAADKAETHHPTDCNVQTGFSTKPPCRDAACSVSNDANSTNGAFAPSPWEAMAGMDTGADNGTAVR